MQKSECNSIKIPELPDPGIFSCPSLTPSTCRILALATSFRTLADSYPVRASASQHLYVRLLRCALAPAEGQHAGSPLFSPSPFL
jgi:hypothetical protein